MSLFLLHSDDVIEPKAWSTQDLPEGLYPYQQHRAQGTQGVFSPDSHSDVSDALRPDGYQVEITGWAAEMRTPVYARDLASRRRLSPDWTDLLEVRRDTTMRLREELHDTPRVVFLAGRTAECCGRVSELAVFDGTGEPIFDEGLAPHNGEQCEERGVEAFWPCAQQHQPRDGWAPFSHWARQLSLVLRYHNLNHALETPSLTAQGGRHRSQIVVWGTEMLQALHREYSFAHGHPRNGRIQDVKGALSGLPICDLQMADVLWRGAWPGGVAELAHLDGTTAGDDCRAMHQHLQVLLRRQKSTSEQPTVLPHDSPFQIGSPSSFSMASAPSAEKLADREGWKFTRHHGITRTGPRLDRIVTPPPLPVQEPVTTTQDLLRIAPELDHQGATDAVIAATQRLEQGKLRRYLLGQCKTGQCSLCGRTLPASYLHVAHIKKRGDASDSERRDPAIVMLACILGCDALFEQGELYVDDQGVIHARREQPGSSPDLAAAVRALVGLRCSAYSPRSERYFQAHRQRHGHHTES